MITFWGVVAVLAAVVLGVIVVEIVERVRAKNQAFTNTYLAARQREQAQAADRVLHALYPTTKGPHGYAAQNERRPTTEKKEFLRATHTTDGQPRIRTASTARAGSWPLSEKKARIQ